MAMQPAPVCTQTLALAAPGARPLLKSAQQNRDYWKEMQQGRCGAED